MKKSVIVCDKCRKEIEEKTSTFVTCFVNRNGFAVERCDICEECYNKMFNTQTEKGGVEE